MNNRKKSHLIKVILIISVILVIFSIFLKSALFEREKISYSKIEIIAEDLEIPWEIKFLPDGEMLITERGGSLLRIGKDKNVIIIEGVRHIGEGGLLGLAIHPDFISNNWIYLYFTSDISGKIENRVERYKLDLNKNMIEDRKEIISGIPGAAFHDGGRIMFGPDGYLYITTGDATNEELSQDVSSLAGKILRVDQNGNIPPDNPFENAVYSHGHRNSQGIAWDGEGRLWATEHGRSGAQSGLDELNLIEKGRNYGWPVIEGSEAKEQMEPPIIQSGSDKTWAPAGAVFFNGSIFFAGLRGEALYKYDLKEKSLTEYFKNEFGRLRAVALHDNFIYLSTSNKDGRGTIRERDDKIIRISMELFS